MHDLPWRVEYFKPCPEWHEKSRPRVVDRYGELVFEMPQNVNHPGQYDEQADECAQFIVESVNDLGKVDPMAICRVAIATCKEEVEKVVPGQVIENLTHGSPWGAAYLRVHGILKRQKMKPKKG